MDVYCAKTVTKVTFSTVKLGDVFYDCDYTKPLIKISEQAAFSPDDNCVHPFPSECYVVVVPSTLDVDFDNPFDR